MSTFVVVLICSYLVLIAYLGIYAHRGAAASAEDYFVANRSVSWLHLGLTFFATWFSTLAFLGVSGFNYQKGVSWYFVQGTFWMLAPIAAWILGRRIWLLGKKHHYITPGDLLADAYKSQTVRFLTGAIGTLSLIPYTLVQLVGIGKVFEAGTEGAISYSTAVGITVVATAFYTVLGGVRAIIWTDIIQGLLFLSITLLGVYIAAEASGGLLLGLSTAQQTRPEAFHFDLSNIGAQLTTIVVWTPGFVLLPHLWQRNYMARSTESFSRGIVAFSLMSFVLLISTMLIGITAISFVGELSDSDKLVPLIFRDYAPGLLPLLMLATFAAGMSTIDSQLLTSSSIIVRDVLSPLGLPKLSPVSEKRLGRVIVVVLVVGLSQLALLPESQGAIFTLATKGTAMAFLLLVPLFGALREGRLKNQSKLLSLSGISTLGIGLSIFVILEVINFQLPYGFGNVIAAFLTQVLVLSAFIWRETNKTNELDREQLSAILHEGSARASQVGNAAR